MAKRRTWFEVKLSSVLMLASCCACGGTAVEGTAMDDSPSGGIGPVTVVHPGGGSGGGVNTVIVSTAGSTGYSAPGQPAPCPAVLPADGSACYDPAEYASYSCSYSVQCTTVVARCISGGWELPEGHIQCGIGGDGGGPGEGGAIGVAGETGIGGAIGVAGANDGGAAGN